MEERGSKTIICSVFFLDIVEYSKKSVSGQISLKERFNAFLSTAIRDVPINDRIILDTGDGAAISFLGDVEDALRAALSMRSSLLDEDVLVDPPLLVRMGVNLGPVRLVKDINGQPNIVGDGINVAQRVMGFADPGQILVSRSYYDAASRLSQEYAGMFHYEGSRTDKHVREHEVYAIGYPGDLTASQKAAGQRPVSSLAKALIDFRVKGKQQWLRLVTWHNEQAEHVRDVFSQASAGQKTMYVGLVSIPLVLIVLLVVKVAHKSEPQLGGTQKMATMPAPSLVSGQSSVAATSAPALASSATTAKPQPPVEEAKQGKHAKAEKKEKTDKQVAQTKAPTEKKEDRKVKSKEPVVADAAPAFVALAVKPWGEVYVDGVSVGVSPPLTKLQVSPGEHVIEIRNTTFQAHKQSVNLKAGEKLSIAHKFAG